MAAVDRVETLKAKHAALDAALQNRSKPKTFTRAAPGDAKNQKQPASAAAGGST